MEITSVGESLDAEPGEEVSLNCKVAGYPSPTITWKKEGTVLSTAKAPDNMAPADLKDLVYPLVLSNVTSSVEVSCSAENSEGAAFDRLLINVKGKSTFS